MANGIEAAEKGSARSSSGRGPSYPAFPVEQAIAKAMQFWAAEKRGAAPIAAAAKHWGYSETSSSGKVAVAALLHYGFLEDQGSRDSRTVKLTARGLDIVLDSPDSPRRLKAIQDAVWAPKLYSDILSKWTPQELPSDQTLRYYLLREKAFNESTVDDFIKDFRASVSYAKLDKPTTIPESESPNQGDKSDLERKQAPEIGDLIHWESGGVLRLEAPRRVRAKQEHEGSWWVFVDGSETGIPMDEAIVVERKSAEENPRPAAKTPPVLPMGQVALQAQVQPEKGEQEWLRGRLSKDVNYRLFMSGEFGSKEIAKLITLLEAQRAVLDEE